MTDHRLTQGKVLPLLLNLAFPLMATGFIQLAYSLTDIFWISKLGVEAVAGAGTMGYYIWLASAIGLIARTGVSVLSASAFGRHQDEEALAVTQQGLILACLLGLALTIVLSLWAEPLIGFFSLGKEASKMASLYLGPVSLAMPALLMNPVFATAYHSYGNSQKPFLINATGLISNMLLDPLMIFGWGPVPGLGMEGAAWATLTANYLVFFLYLILLGQGPFKTLFTKWRGDISTWVSIIRLGFPSALQNALHAGISLVLNRLVARSGDLAVAVYSAGSQIESITWATTEGLSYALTAFVGQNYGAKKKARVGEGIKQGMGLVALVGILGSILLIGGRYQIFALLMGKQADAIALGASYLIILGSSQFLMSLEIGSTGVFYGIGETRVPSVVSIFLNLARLPLAYVLALSWGAQGVWVAIALSSSFKGLITPGLLLASLKKRGIFPKKTTKVIRENAE